MQTLSVCLVNALIGAVIGAGTNELAVRWIFWRIIPSKKGELAEKVQEVVSSRLMTPEKIVGRLRSESVRDAVCERLSAFVDGKCREDLPSPAELFQGRGELLERIEKNIVAALFEGIRSFVSSDEFHNEKLLPAARQFWDRRAGMRLDELISDKDAVFKGVPAAAASWLTGESFRQKLAASVSELLLSPAVMDSTLGSLLPSGFERDIRSLVLEQTPLIMSRFASLLERPELKNRLSEMIRETVADKIDDRIPGWVHKTAGIFTRRRLGGVLSSKLGPDIGAFCDELPGRLVEEAENPRNEPHYSRFASETAAEIMGMKVSELLKDDARGKVEGFVSHLLDKLASGEGASMIERAVSDAVDRLLARTPAEIMEKLGVGMPPEAVAALIAGKLREALSSAEFRRDMLGSLRDLAEEFKHRRVGRLEDSVPKKARDLLCREAGGVIVDFAAENFEAISNVSGVWGVISETIKNYENKEIEKVVRQIANRELVWVTVMGGVLGAVVGFLQGLMNALKLLDF